MVLSHREHPHPYASPVDETAKKGHSPLEWPSAATGASETIVQLDTPRSRRNTNVKLA